jgi:hypothetical protein
MFWLHIHGAYDRNTLMKNMKKPGWVVYHKAWDGYTRAVMEDWFEQLTPNIRNYIILVDRDR